MVYFLHAVKHKQNLVSASTIKYLKLSTHKHKHNLVSASTIKYLKLSTHKHVS